MIYKKWILWLWHLSEVFICVSGCLKDLLHLLLLRLLKLRFVFLSWTLNVCCVAEAAVRKVCVVVLQLILPEAWRKTLPPEQQEWVSNALFVKDQTGRPVFSQNLQLWYHPPGPKQVYHQCPSNYHDFYQRPFFLWVPYRMWHYHLKCPDCGLKLTGCGIYRTVRKVLDTNGWYYMATEYLECRYLWIK